MNPPVAALLQMLKAATPPDAPRLWQLSPADARVQSNRFFAPLNAGGPTVAETREVTIPGRRGAIRARLYVPHGAPSTTPWGDRDLVLSRTVMDWFQAHYRGGRARPGDPYLAPLNADLTGFPPSIVVCGTLDPLLSDSQLFAAALEKAGTPVELHIYDDGIHAFVQMPMLDMATEAIAKLCAFAKQRF